MKRCSKCVLPRNYPGLEFNQVGVCSFCLRHENAKYRGEEELDKFLKASRRENADFDVVAGISGGRDSSYLLYYLVRICKLKVLAYCSDNGFIPDETKIHIRKIADTLNTELVIEKHNLLKKRIKSNFHSWLRDPSPGMISMICCGCRLGMFSGLLRCAKKYGIPIIALGMAPIERTMYKRTFLRTNPLGRIIGVRSHGRLSLALGLLYEALKNPFYFLNPINLMIYVKEYLYFFHLKTMTKLLYPKQKILFFYRYIKWDEKEIESVIENEFSLPAPSWRSGCKIGPIKNDLLRKTAGFTEDDDILSNMIRENMITRDEALAKLKEKTSRKKPANELYAEVMI